MTTFLEFKIIGLFLFFLIPVFIVVGFILIIVGAILNSTDNNKKSLEQELDDNFGNEESENISENIDIKNNPRGKKTLKIGLYFLVASGILSLIVYALCS